MSKDIWSKFYIENIQNGFWGEQSNLPNTIPIKRIFFGREAELKKLREFYKDNTRSFVFYGSKGVGKTALAIQFANEILSNSDNSNEYDAKLFISMRNSLPDSDLSRDVMLEIVRQFDQTNLSDISDHQLKSTYLQCVQSHKTIIVLDNIEDKQTAEPLLDAKACFIITSPKPFVFLGSKRLLVENLTADQAQNLLFEIVDKEKLDGRAKELVELTGCNPMALILLATILAENESETVLTVIEAFKKKRASLNQSISDEKELINKISFDLNKEKLPIGKHENILLRWGFEPDFNNKREKPLRKKLFLATILVLLLFLLSIPFYQWVEKSKWNNTVSYPLSEIFDTEFDIVPPTDSYKVKSVTPLPALEYSDFEFISDERLIDLRKWMPVEKGQEGRISPVTWHREIQLKKKSSNSDWIRFRFETDGSGIDARCVSGQDYHIETSYDSTHNPPQLFMKKNQIVINVAKYKIDEIFTIKLEATFWNGTTKDDTWVAPKIFAPVQKFSIKLFFPKNKPLINSKLVMYDGISDEEKDVPENQRRNVVIPPDHLSLHWEIENPTLDHLYEVQWEW
ncbi:MAG: NB-ARC domain-containing protein [Pyrinomonadaceae bacterium]|nr:NB-ARC domain-containing protein [Pyrinomonadaceae bacterium]